MILPVPVTLHSAIWAPERNPGFSTRRYQQPLLDSSYRPVTKPNNPPLPLPFLIPENWSYRSIVGVYGAIQLRGGDQETGEYGGRKEGAKAAGGEGGRREKAGRSIFWEGSPTGLKIQCGTVIFL